MASRPTSAGSSGSGTGTGTAATPTPQRSRSSSIIQPHPLTPGGSTSRLMEATRHSRQSSVHSNSSLDSQHHQQHHRQTSGSSASGDILTLAHRHVASPATNPRPTHARRPSFSTRSTPISVATLASSPSATVGPRGIRLGLDGADQPSSTQSTPRVKRTPSHLAGPSHRKMASTQIIAERQPSVQARPPHKRSHTRNASQLPPSITFGSNSGQSTATPNTPLTATSAGTPILPSPMPRPSPSAPADYSRLLMQPELNRNRRRLKRSASFGELNKRSCPSWVAAEVRTETKAAQSFQVTQLQREKVALANDLEQARLVISDLRYAQWRKDAQFEKTVELHKNLTSIAERKLDDMKMKYLQQRLTVTYHKRLLLHVGVIAFARSYAWKKRMRQLHIEIASLVRLLDAHKDPTTGDLGMLLPQAETHAFVEDANDLWGTRIRPMSLCLTSSDTLISNLLDGVSALRTAMESTLQLTAVAFSTTDKIFERNKTIMAHNLDMRQDLEHLNSGSEELWREPTLLPKILRRMKREEAAAELAAEAAIKGDAELARKEAELLAVIAPRPPRVAPPFAISASRGRRATHSLPEEKSLESDPLTRPPSAHHSSSSPSHSPPLIPRRPTPSSSIARIELSANGLAYHHRTRTSKQKRQDRNRKQAEAALSEIRLVAASRAASVAQLHSRPTIPDPPPHELRHYRPHPSMEYEPASLAVDRSLPPPPPPLPPPSLRVPRFAFPTSHDDTAADDDNDMMVGWRDDTDDQPRLQSISFEYHAQQPATFSADHDPPFRAEDGGWPQPSDFVAPTRPAGLGLARFRFVALEVLARVRRRFDHVNAALEEDLANMHLDPDVD